MRSAPSPARICASRLFIVFLMLITGGMRPARAVDPSPLAPGTCTDADFDTACDQDDNCPGLANSDQLDTDGDGIGDACDPCTDSDGDGFGDSCLGASVCPVDNCIRVANPTQTDSDHDGMGDACDPCPFSALNDPDYDGACDQVDDCPGLYNPTQADADGDGRGDLCDNCVAVANFDQRDQDSDTIGDACDVCVTVYDPSQPDSDGDRVGDVCDNCPAVPNPAQDDFNHDGSGDACQPRLTIAGILQDGGADLEVKLLAGDPQGDPLSGGIEVLPGSLLPLALLDTGLPIDCSRGYPADGVPGEGIGFVLSAGRPFLFDLDAYGDCHDGVADFEIAYGGCDNPSAFADNVDLGGTTPPASFCFRRIGQDVPRYNLIVESFDTLSLTAQVGPGTASLAVPFSGGLPARVGIASLPSGAMFTLVIRLTDGTTVPVGDQMAFLHQSETSMVFGITPLAVIAAPAQAECDGNNAAHVTLDSSGSQIAPSPTGGNPIAAWQWFRDYATPSQQVLGLQAVLPVILPLGPNRITLRVADLVGGWDTADAVVTITDTQPPSLSVTGIPAVLWPPNHRLVPVRPAWQAADACDPLPSITLASISSSEPEDLPGDADGQTGTDILDASTGTADGDFRLRAERARDGAGRTYSLVYTAQDHGGNVTSRSAGVGVPLDGTGGPEPLRCLVDLDPQTGASRVDWNGVAGAAGYDVISGDLGSLTVRGDVLDLGAVRVLARETAGVSASEAAGAPQPQAGSAFFYLVQYHDASGASGYGTESAPWPREPSSCGGGCP